MNVAAWLRSLGLERYEQSFRDNDIDVDLLPELMADDLIGLGVTSIGHRRKLLAAIAALRERAPTSVDITGIGAATPSQEDAGTGGAERRQLTVMFCDLVGSTSLAERLDPEDLREIIGAYHRRITDTVAPFTGFVAKYMGDGALIYFGYPRAYEDDAERAVKAALALVAAIAAIDAADLKLRLRVGIATGLVVVGDLLGSGAAREEAVVGGTPNLAARLQSLAEPNTIVIADSTRRLVGSLFDLIDLGSQELKGITLPQRIWQVIGASRIRSRFEALRSGESPLVGREEELELLGQRWSQARAGQGQVVLLSGEPGIGKSRLTTALQERLDAEPRTRIRYFCSPHHQDSALYPVIGQLERAAGFGRHDTPAVKLDKLEALLASASRPAGDVSLIAELLSLPGSGRYPPLELGPQRKKERILTALFQLLGSFARQLPVLMIFEDLHWIDPTSRELLDLIVERVERLPVLLIATLRPEFQPPWTDRPQVTVMPLTRLNRSEGMALVRQLLVNTVSLPSDVVDEIIERTDGVPLFLEELTKAVVEAAAAAGDGGRGAISAVPARSVAVPATLYASLTARLDRLGPTAKEIAQIGAAIGREFSYELLAAVAQPSEPELRNALGRLVDAGLVFQRGLPPQASYLFKHALVQDTAHSSLLRGPRQALHARIARALEERFPTIVQTRPELPAHHFTEAGLLNKAVAYWCRAGQQSVARSALVEGIAQLRRGLRLVTDLAETSERKEQELDLQVTLAGALTGAKGFAHQEVIEAFDQARKLITDTAGAGTLLHFSVLYGLYAANFVGGRPKPALEQAMEFLSLAECQTESGPLLMGHRVVGTVLALIGDYPAALAHLERAVALYVPEEHRMLAFRFGADIGVSALSSHALALWNRGYPEQASNAVREALRHARQSVHVHTLAYALVVVGVTAVSGRWTPEVEELANEAVALANERGFAFFQGWGLILQGWAMAQRGFGMAAVERVHEGLKATEATGAGNYKPLLLGLLAEALAIAGAIQDGLAVVAEALAMAETSGQKGTDAELHRLRGDLLRRLPDPDLTECEACFRKALAVAREQGTRGFELRAAVSLARLLSGQGRRNEARDLLAPVYCWYTEGFDTPDLKDARALLEALDA
jgi:class 3 adenylate cyclase/predicted ATPase